MPLRIAPRTSYGISKISVKEMSFEQYLMGSMEKNVSVDFLIYLG